MNLLSRLFGRDKETAVSMLPQHPQPYGLRFGAVVEVDALPFHCLADHLLFALPGAPQVIVTRGHIDLGAGTALHRFYLEDELWLQVKTTGGHAEAHVDEVKLFQFYQTETPGTQAELNAIAGPQSPLGLPTYTIAGKHYNRVWGSGTGQTELVPFSEQVFGHSRMLPSYRCEHLAMLYERPLGNGERMEYLLVSVEDSADGISVVTSVGVDLSSADFRVV